MPWLAGDQVRTVQGCRCCWADVRVGQGRVGSLVCPGCSYGEFLLCARVCPAEGPVLAERAPQRLRRPMNLGTANLSASEFRAQALCAGCSSDQITARLGARHTSMTCLRNLCGRIEARTHVTACGIHALDTEAGQGCMPAFCNSGKDRLAAGGRA
jgi:hypothetical protein